MCVTFFKWKVTCQALLDALSYKAVNYFKHKTVLEQLNVCAAFNPRRPYTLPKFCGKLSQSEAMISYHLHIKNRVNNLH